MFTRSQTVTFKGMKVVPVDVEVHIAPGLPSFVIVGLPDKAVNESKERVRASLQSIGLTLPAKKITVNLTPADQYKEGSHFDLPIAMALLAGMMIFPKEYLDEYLIAGELSLNGTVKNVAGILPMSMHANENSMGIICAKESELEANWAGNPKVVAGDCLITLIKHFKGEELIQANEHKIEYSLSNDNNKKLDMSDIIGQKIAKRAIEVAAAGRHNLLMSGPPGAGKSMLAKRLPGIMPKLSTKEVLETSIVFSIAGQLEDGQLIIERPFRAPHHSCSVPAMVGGGVGQKVKPGEISLANNGILFLDELPEFSRVVLDSLRQPMESAEVLISRAQSHVTFPAKFQLIAAMNPCPCGYLNDADRQCSKAPICAENYLSKVSGPLLDRIDIHLNLQPIPLYELNKGNQAEEKSIDIAKRVAMATEIQEERYKKTHIRYNSELDGDLLKEWVQLDDEAHALINKSVEIMKLSMRSYTRILRVARTIADLAGQKTPEINKLFIAEAVNYRKVDCHK